MKKRKMVLFVIFLLSAYLVYGSQYDLNSDRLIDLTDLGLLQEKYGLTESDSGFNAMYDYNSDSVLDSLDGVILAGYLDIVKDMAFVPEGVFFRGGKYEDTGIWQSDTIHVYLDSFWMDRYEATVKEFCEFLNDGNRGFYKLTKMGSDPNIPNHPKDTVNRKYPLIDSGEVFTPYNDFDSMPISHISWYAADAFCKWKKMELPTTAEWEKAARGITDTRLYPWGNEVLGAGDIGIMGDDTIPFKIGSFIKDTSIYGLYDLIGNVSEWTRDWFDTDYQAAINPRNNPVYSTFSSSKAIKGAAWFEKHLPTIIQGSNFKSKPYVVYYAHGMRCIFK